MHFLRFLFSLFYIFYLTSSAMTLKRTNNEDLKVIPLQFTVNPKPTATDTHNSSKIFLKSNDHNQFRPDVEFFQKPNDKKLCNEELLKKILYLILEKKNIENGLRDSNSNNLVQPFGIGLDYYDAVEEVKMRQIPDIIKTPKKGLLGRLHLKFEPINNNRNYNYGSQGKKHGRYGKEKYIH